MMPYFQGNPYQELLADVLQEQGCEVCLANGHQHEFPLYQTAGNHGAQLLHLHWMHSYCEGMNVIERSKNALRYVLDLALLRLRGVPLVWTVHNVLSHETPYPAIELWVRRRIAHMAHALIVHDTHTKALVAETYRIAPERVHVVPHGNYRGFYGDPVPIQQARAALGLPSEGRLFLHLGMLRPYKGTIDLLEIWPEYHRMHPEDHLLIVGEPYDKVYAHSVQQHCEQTPGAFFHSGYVPDEKIACYYSAADVVVLPFRRITSSGSLVLAMSYSKPVIAPRMGGLPETLMSATDLLYDEPSQEALLQALKRSNDVDLDRLAAATWAACEELSWERVGQATRAAYPFVIQEENREPRKILSSVGQGGA